MYNQFAYNLEILLESIELFYLKYEANTTKIKKIREIMVELVSKDFNSTFDVNRLGKIKLLIAKLNTILRELNIILFKKYENCKDYPILKEYLKNHEYYSQDDRNKAFQMQLKGNDYGIYLINGLKLVNLFDNTKIISFATKSELENYIKDTLFEVIIKPKTNNFEIEYKNYYNYLLKHGYNYSKSEIYDPFTMAEELACLFDGKVLTEGFCFYSNGFNYPKDFDNGEYLKKLKEFVILHHNETFKKDYKEMCLLEKKMQLQIDKLIEIAKKYSSIIKVMYEDAKNILLNSEILFLQKCYTAYEPRLGHGEYQHIDYYKALEVECLRKNLNDKTLGSWKLCRGSTNCYDRQYNIFIWKKYLIGNLWRMYSTTM